MTSFLPVLRELTRLRFTARVGRYFLAALLCGVAAPLALAIDLPAVEWFSTVHIPSELRRMIQLSEVVAAGSSVLWIALLVGVLDRRGGALGALVAAQALCSGLVADLGKMIVARNRPWTLLWPSEPPDLGRPFTAADTFGAWFPFRDEELLTSGFQSFPSGHAATAVGLATILALAYPRGRSLFALFAVLACLQRLHCQAHFPSDVLAGAAIGFTCAGVTDLCGWNWGLNDPDGCAQRSVIARYFRGAGPT